MPTFDGRDAEPQSRSSTTSCRRSAASKSDATDLTAGGRRVLNAAETQVTRSKAFVNTNWPLVPPED